MPIKIDFQEFIKWFLPIALTFIGWYVSQTIAPIDSEINRLRELTEQHTIQLSRMEAHHNSQSRTIGLLETELRRLHDTVLRESIVNSDHREHK